MGVLGPYSPAFERSAPLVRNLTEASALAAWIRQQTVDVSWIAPAQRDTMIRMAHFSTRIEGNPLTLPEVTALAMGKDLSVEGRAKREILNYFAALRWIWRKSPPRDVLEEDLLNLHKLLTQGWVSSAEAGRYKSKPNAIYQGAKIVYRPPSPETAAPLTRALLDWANSSAGRKEHAIVVSAIAHHRLVSIHPFMDGNGRTSRALGSWILFRRGFDTHHIFALDEFFEINRPRYYEEIQSVRDKGDDLSSWLEYVSEGVVETLRKTQRRIQALRTRKSAAPVVLTRPQERILQLLGEVPTIAGGEMARSLKMTRSHLSKLLKPLIRAGLVVKEGSTKAAHYRLA